MSPTDAERVRDAGLPPVSSRTTKYRFDSALAPLVLSSEGKPMRVRDVEVVEHEGGDPAPSVSVVGYVVKANGERDLRSTYLVPANREVRMTFLALHLKATR